MGMGQLDIHVQNRIKQKELNSYLIAYTEINSKM